MAELLFKNESQLISKFIESQYYKSFKEKRFPDKINREAKASELLKRHFGHYSKEILNEIFDLVDYFAPNKRWFGQLLATPNRNLIFQTDISIINERIKDLYEATDKKSALNKFQEERIRGASKGLATLMLYLFDPHCFNIWVNKTLEGLTLLKRIKDIRGLKWGNKYEVFNLAANEFKEEYKFEPQEIDWILSYISSKVKVDQNGFRVEEFDGKLEINDSPKIWVEKSFFQNRPDRQSGDRALGKALWSPRKAADGKDIYHYMRDVNPGDIILHLVDDGIIRGISIAKTKCEEADGLPETEWNVPSYLIELQDYTELKPTIKTKEFLVEKNRSILEAIKKKSEVFYNKLLRLREGAYLTPCHIELFKFFNGIYKSLSSNDLPYANLLYLKLTENVNQVPFKLENIVKDCSNSGLQFDESLIARFVASLITKPFVILTGLSGSGKTKLAQAFAMWICEDESQFCIVPVGADWTNRDVLLGFPNALTEKEYVKPDNGFLNLLIESNKNPNKPYFLILDEMNLSHVERYFADLLSVMESQNNITLHPGANEWNGVPNKISLPKNLFIIGTVNIDETTYMFSPKVLDRANVIEFMVSSSEMKKYLYSHSSLNLTILKALGASMGKSIVEMAKDCNIKLEDVDTINDTLMCFFEELKKIGAEFGYRSASEIIRLVSLLKVILPSFTISEMIDIAIIQKLLPKVHGSRRKLEPILRTMAGLCIMDKEKVDEYIKSSDKQSGDILYPMSLRKLCRMYDNLLSNGFTSFTEA